MAIQKPIGPHSDPELLTRQSPSDNDGELPHYLAIRDALTEAIRSGKLGGGARLPSERELAEAHGVARMTARKALGLLESEGTIYRSERRGYFVSPTRVRFNPSSPTNMMRQFRRQGFNTENIYLGRQAFEATEWYAVQFNVPEGTLLTMDRSVVEVEGRRIVYEELCLLPELVPGYTDQAYVSPLWQNLETNFGITPKRKHTAMRVTNISFVASKHLNAPSTATGLSFVHVQEHDGRVICVDRSFWLADAVEIEFDNCDKT